jgi:hypothetical protein
MSLEQVNRSDNSSQHDSGLPQSEATAGQRPEHTLIGCVIGELRDKFGAPTDAKDAQARASQNDEIGRIAIDVAASLPRVKLVAAGVMHGLALIDPHADLKENASSFALNTASGLALNGTVRATLPGSKLSRWTADTLGMGLQGQTASHFITGAGFGLARGTFDAQTWLDKNGNFSATQGVERLALSTFISSVTNVPAGFAGGAIARLMTSGAADSALTRISTGIGSGFAGGGVFGFTDAWISTGSITDSGTAFLKGGLVGAFTGGAISGFHGGPGSILEPVREIRSSRAPESHPIETVHGSQDIVYATAAAPPKFTQILEDGGATRRQMGVPLDEVSRMEIGLPKYDAFAERLKALPKPTIGTYKREILKDNMLSMSSMEDFINSLKEEERDAVIYKYGPTKIVVPADYHAELLRVRELRLAASQPSRVLDRPQLGRREGLLTLGFTPEKIDALEGFAAAAAQARSIKAVDPSGQILTGLCPSWFDFHEIGNLTPSDLHTATSVLRALQALNDHPYGTRALPEDVAAALDRLPNRALVTSVELLNERSFRDLGTRMFDEWVKKNYPNGDFRSAADAFIGTGRMRLFEATLSRFDNNLYELLKHEQVHFNHSNVYAYARTLDGNAEASFYANRNDRESEAELESVVFLGPHLDKFFRAVDEVPVRMAVLARKQINTIESAPKEHRSLDQHEILARARFVNKHALSNVMSRVIEDATINQSADSLNLMVYLNNGKPEPQVQTVLLDALQKGSWNSTPVILNGLVGMGDASVIPRLADVLKSPALGGAQHSVIEVMAKLSGNPEQQVRSLLAWAGDDSAIKDEVRQYILKRQPNLLQSRFGTEILMTPPGEEAATLSQRARYTLTHGDDLQKLVAIDRVNMLPRSSDYEQLMSLATDASKIYAKPALATALKARYGNDRVRQFTELEPLTLSTSRVKGAARQLIDEWGGDERARHYRNLLHHLMDPILFAEDAAKTLNQLPETSPRAQWVQEFLNAIHTANGTDAERFSPAEATKKFLGALYVSY